MRREIPRGAKPACGFAAAEVGWREADAYFRDNPNELVARMFQWARKDDRRAARNLLSRWLRSEHPELKCAGQAALETWIECFYSEEAYRPAYQEWKLWYAAHRDN